jgi:hypothetical protein
LRGQSKQLKRFLKSVQRFRDENLRRAGYAAFRSHASSAREYYNAFDFLLYPITEVIFASSSRKREDRCYFPPARSPLPTTFDEIMGSVTFETKWLLLVPRPSGFSWWTCIVILFLTSTIGTWLSLGLSGWAQVRYGYATDADDNCEKLQHNLACSFGRAWRRPFFFFSATQLRHCEKFAQWPVR